MVFEHLAAFFVDKFLGNYIEGFDSDQLKLNVWHGDITLQNVHLKSNALDQFNLPVQMITGYLETLKIHIPWKHLYSHPTKIQLDGFYLLLSPKTEVTNDLEEIEEEEYQSKMKEIEKVENFRREREFYEMNKRSSHQKDTFFQRLQYHILRNVEIELTNVHLAFDDKTTKSYSFQFGITLNSFKLYRTNNQWEDSPSNEDEDLISKFGQMNDFYIYWNSNIKSRLDLTKEEILDDLKFNKYPQYHQRNSIIQPLNIQAKLIMGKLAEEQHFSYPILDCQLNFDQISLNINQNQYSDILDLLEFGDYLNRKKKSIKYKSINSNDNLSLQRWKFAYQAIVIETVRPRLSSFKWENIKENLDRYREYRQVYLQQLNSHFAKEHQGKTKELEKQIDLFNLISIRRQVQIEYKKKKLEEKEISWWDKLNHWWNSNSNSNEENSSSQSLTTEEKIQFYEAIGYKDQQGSKELIYPDEYIDLKISLQLNLIEINVWSLINEKDSNLKMIARASLEKNQFQFSRRPAKDDILFIIDIDSFEVDGIDCEEMNELNLSRPILISSLKKDERKLLHIEFETNPLHSKADYRIKGLSQSLQINYHAMTVNKLIECFLPDREHDLQGLKEAAYSIYTDIKHRTQFLVSENLKKIQDLDICIEFQSIYFVIHDKGSSLNLSSKICLDFGRFTIKGGEKNLSTIEENTFYETNSDVEQTNEVPLKIQLENVQLLYLNSNEDWMEISRQEQSPAHLIKPIQLTLNILKSKIIDNPQIPIWKADGEIPSIALTLSDTRLVGFVQLITTIPFPQTNEKTKKEEKYDTNEKMTPTKKILYEYEKETEQDFKEKELLQLQASFQITKIDILFQRALLELTDYTEDFLLISLSGLVGSTKIQTYSLQFNTFLEDFFIEHQQFMRDDKNKMQIISKEKTGNLIQMNGLLTSTSNPSFHESPFNSLENNISIEINQILFNFQYEILSSIILFQNHIQNKLPSSSSKPSDSPPKEKESSSSTPSFRVNLRLEGISILIGNSSSHLLYMQLKQLHSYVSRTNIQILIHFILEDLFILDPNPKSFYQTILSKEDSSKDFLQIDLALFNYANKLIPRPKDSQSSLKGYFQKCNFIFLFKHFQLISSIINSFGQNKEDSPPKQEEEEDNVLISTLKSYEEHQLEFDFDFLFHGPKISIPLNSSSNEYLSIDLGQLILRNDSSSIQLENLSIDIFSSNQINLIKTSPLILSIDRQLKNELSIVMQWDSIQLQFSNWDYSFLQKILHGNFQEKSSFLIPQIQSSVEKESTKTPVKNLSKPKKKISYQIRLDLSIKEIDFTIFLKENLHQSSRNEQEKLIHLTIEKISSFLEKTFHNQYQGKFQIEQIMANHLKGNEQFFPIIKRGFNGDQNSSLLIFNLNSEKSIRKVNGQMESFDLLINPDLINSMNKFVKEEISIKENPAPLQTNSIEINLPSPAKSISQGKPIQVKKPSSPTKSPQTPSNSSIETSLEFVLKESHLILVEDRKKNPSESLLLNFSLNLNLINNGDSTKISISLKDLHFYGSTFEDINQFQIKYSILEPTQINLIFMQNIQERKMDLQLEDVAINIDPILIRTFISLTKSIETEEKSQLKKAKEKIDLKSLFQPKPFKDSSFWYLQDSQEKEELLEENDLLELTTGEPSQKKNPNKEKEKEKAKEESLREQLILQLNIIEIKVELGKGSSTRPVVALCLSEIFANIENWSSDILLTASVQIELALFNDHLLAWEPLIEPIIDEKGSVISPWTIISQTIQNDEEENVQQNRYLLSDDMSEEKEKNTEKDLDIKKLISIRGEHLLNLTLTKTTLDLIEQIQIMFNQAYQNENYSSDDDQQQALLTIQNQTGQNIQIDQLIGLKFDQIKEENVALKDKEILHLTVPSERLDASHLPAITEQISKRKQRFQAKIEDVNLTIDINQTWRRVYQLFPSSNPSWPIELLCDSSIFEDRRRIILSSIIKVSNRTLMPLLILDGHAIEKNEFNILIKVNPSEEYYLPIQLIYLRSATRIYFSFQQSENSLVETKDFLSFDWTNESITDRIFKLNDGKQSHLVIYKEEISAYEGNTDEPIKKSFNIYVKHALHLFNLLPIPIQCSIDNIENVAIKSGELYHSIEGKKKSLLIFQIPSYLNKTWISQTIDLNEKGHGNHNEHIVLFHDQITNENLRMVLRVETYRGSYRASFYSPYWIVNATDLKFQMKIENEKNFLDNSNETYLICPNNFDSQSKKKKGYIRVVSIEESRWSEGFSVDVIKSSGMTSCYVNNDRTYMILIDIVTSSFGMTKLITLAPSTAIINHSSRNIEINEINEETNWKLVQSNQIIPYWPRYIKEGRLWMRYEEDPSSNVCFSISEKDHRLLKINNEEYPAIHLEITATDYDGYRVIFNDYHHGDAPLLILNGILEQNLSFSQKDDLRTHVLPYQHYVYSTWDDPLKDKELIILINQQSYSISLNPCCGMIEKDSSNPIYYSVFNDGLQTVLILTRDLTIIQSVSQSSSMIEKMSNYIEISLHAIGISVINDVSCDDLFYMTINPSKELWIERRNYRIQPLSQKLNKSLDQQYQHYLKEYSQNELTINKYSIDQHRFVIFDGLNAEISDENGNSINVQRENLDGLWAGVLWSSTNQSFHLKINNLQIDNQLSITLFPTILYPIVSKSSATDIPGKAFIELNVFKSESTHSKTIEIKYLKLLIQEFAVAIDQGLILGIIHFVEKEKNPAAPKIDMEGDLKRLANPLERILQGQNENSTEESKIYFDNLHLSPLKIHVSFSMHGSKANEQLLAEYPLVDFILQILNVAEVQDVILKLKYYERKHDRFTQTRLIKEISDHYENEFLKQIHVVVLGLDVLGNPFGLARGIAEGVESFFYEPYKGAMEGPMELIEGVATGTKNLFGSVVGGAAGALSKVTQATSKGLATLTLDEDYQNARIQRKEIQSQTTPEIVSSGKNVVKDIKLGVKGLVKKPIQGAKHGGAKGFFKGLGKGFLGFVGRPASGVADLTSTSFKLIKKVATNEEVIHRIRNPRHIGRDGLVRPSIPHETLGNFIFDKLNVEHHSENEGYIAHIDSSSNPHSLFFATTKRIIFLTESEPSSNEYRIEWDHHYKDIKGEPKVNFEPNYIEITLKETNALGMTKKDSVHVKVVPYDSIGEARYIVDKIIETTNVLEV